MSLFDDPWVWWSLGSMLALTIAMTFVLPKLHRPPKTGLGDTGLPENAVPEGRVDEPDEPGVQPASTRRSPGRASPDADEGARATL